jgi:hypothetical protein
MPSAIRGNSEAMDANARLIAAAPELLEALEGLVDSIEKFGIGRTRNDGYFDSAYAAIRKARGE